MDPGRLLRLVMGAQRDGHVPRRKKGG
jgi:hypothetical protein